MILSHSCDAIAHTSHEMHACRTRTFHGLWCIRMRLYQKPKQVSPKTMPGDAEPTPCDSGVKSYVAVLGIGPIETTPAIPPFRSAPLAKCEEN